MSNPPRPTKIGVLGCASIATRSVIPAILELEAEFKLVAVASRSRDKAGSVATLFRCEAATYEELVDSQEIDALYVPLPTGLHKEWIHRAIRAGKHVYAEKSLAHCSIDAEGMIAEAQPRGLALMEGLMFQYHRQQREARVLLDSGAIGDLRHFYGAFGFPPLDTSNFRYSEEVGGGALLDAAAYPLRAAHRILGDSLAVRGATLFVPEDRGTSIFGSAFLSDSKGLGAAIAFGFDNFYQCRYEIWGSKGKMTLSRAYTPRPDFSPEIQLETANGINTIAVAPDNHFVRAFEEFHRAIGDASVQAQHYSDISLQSRSLDEIRKLASATTSNGESP